MNPSNNTDRAIKQLQLGHVQTAEELAQQALAHDQKDVQAHAVLGQIATMQGVFDKAIEHLSTCVRLAPKEIDLQVLLAEAYSNCARHSEALSRYDRALRLQRQYPPALAGKANVLLRQAKLDKAHALLEPLVKAGTEEATVALVYAKILHRQGRSQDAIDVVRRHLDDPVQPRVIRTLNFQLARLLDSSGAYDQAFDVYLKANGTAKGIWDGDAEAARYDQTIEVFSAQTLQRLPRPSHPTDLPIFIVGMQRSGSTLVEQIIDAHPEAHGAGELLLMHQLTNVLGLKIGSTLPYPRCVADLDQGDVDMLSSAYLEQLRPLAPQARRISDKYLGNYEHVGLISVLLPQARIIHVRRNPLDNCLSCFFQNFAPGVPAYTEDLHDMGRLYADYERIMRYWDDVLDSQVLEVCYERLVAEPEPQIRRIIDFCGLEFDERCTRFYETGREVLTMSRDQVNKPIYTGSIGRYRRYEDHLAPLKEALITVGGWTEQKLADAARIPEVPGTQSG
jgi:hypothetical protein